MSLRTNKAYFRRGSGGVTRIKRDTYNSNGQSWWEIRKKVLERDNYTCTTPGCNTREDPKAGVYLDVHHIRELSKGGTSTLPNLRSLCKDCHAKRHKHLR